ncbi:MAG: PTS sugar transporter subunit IIC [Lachnospiraceae bacterium]|nr:PTS sugar transporter subunit IIC [Lachnospiraceae bacterium]
MYDAIVVAIAVFIGVAGHELLGMAMLSRPIVVAPLTGLLMGDLQTGLIVGAALETIFMGVVNIGISSTAEPALAAGLAAAFAIKLGGNVDTIIPLVFPLAVLGLQLMNMIFSFVIGPFAPKFRELALEGKDRQITRLHFGLWFLHYGLYALIPFFAVLFGSDVVQKILESIPEVIMNGLTVAGNMLPAVGMAMLMRMLWDNKIAVYFLAGFVCVAYLKLPLISIAALGIVVAVVMAQVDFQIKNVSRAKAAVTSAAETDDKEDFFA